MPLFKQSNSSSTYGYGMAIVSAAILSTTAIFIRYLTSTYQLPALILAFWRDSLVMLTLLVVLAVFRPRLLKIKRRDLSYLVAYGLILAIFNALWTLSVALNGAAISTILVYSSAGFTVLLGRLLLKEQVGWSKLLAVVLSMTGCVLVSVGLGTTVWQANLAGILTGIFSGLFYAIYSLMGRVGSQRQINPWTTILYIFGIAAAFLLVFNLLPGDFLPGTASQPSDLLWLGDVLAGWLVLFLLAAGPTLVGFGLYNVSLGYLPASIVNLIATLEPVFTALLAYFLFNERLNAVQMIGSLMILSSVILLRIYSTRQIRLNAYARSVE